VVAETAQDPGGGRARPAPPGSTGGAGSRSGEPGAAGSGGRQVVWSGGRDGPASAVYGHPVGHGRGTALSGAGLVQGR
jgi:hypothetical protein